MGLSLSAPLLSGVRRVPDANAQHRHRWLHTRVRTHTHTYTHSWPVWTLRVALIDLCGSVKVTRCMWLDESSDFGLPWGIAGTSLMGGFSFATLLSSFFFHLFYTQTPFSCPFALLIWVNFFFLLLSSNADCFHLSSSIFNYSPPPPLPPYCRVWGKAATADALRGQSCLTLCPTWCSWGNSSSLKTLFSFCCTMLKVRHRHLIAFNSHLLSSLPPTVSFAWSLFLSSLPLLQTDVW